jgi:hypothetical protein
VRELTSAIRTSPEVGRSSRYNIRRSVLFPAPLAPVRKTNSRFPIWSETPFSAVVPRGYCLLTFEKRIMLAAGAL